MGNSKGNALFDLLDDCPVDEVIGNHLIKAYAIINRPSYRKILCTISGGADSDVMLDICSKVDVEKKISYVWFDTGLEYMATKTHLSFLEKKYGVKIQTVKAKKSIPFSCKEYGIPFLSKNVSEMIHRLQKHEFQWEDDSFEKLLEKYCIWNEEKQDWRGCKCALAWWCNQNKSIQFNVGLNKGLKEFLMHHPPEYDNLKISSRCCKYAKKDVVSQLIKGEGYDLNISGVRKAEGGIRSTAYKSCFDSNNSYDNYRPLFWYRLKNRQIYEEHYDIIHSECYQKYGLKRTGCAGCPFGNFEFEISVMNQYEPRLGMVAENVFGKSYGYTRKYLHFRKVYLE